MVVKQCIHGVVHVSDCVQNSTKVIVFSQFSLGISNHGLSLPQLLTAAKEAIEYFTQLNLKLPSGTELIKDFLRFEKTFRP